MKPEHQALIQILTDFLERNPSQRFGQALFNLNINGFANPKDPEKNNFYLRDIYNDTDAEILKRINIINTSEVKTKKKSSLTTDPSDPRLGHGIDEDTTPQHEAYLVLSDVERAKEFVRPVRTTYVHAKCGTVN